MDEQNACSLHGAFHVTFAPTADSPQACSCSHCSYDVAPGHVGAPISLASANIEYFLEPLLVGNGGSDPFSTCEIKDVSSCRQDGECRYPSSLAHPGGMVSSTFTF